MSDTGRKDLSTQAKETLTPESQKSTLDQAKESVTDAGDKVAAAVQPGDSKSTTQKLSDTANSNTDSSGQTYVQQAQEVVGNLAESASQTLSNLASSISGEKK